MRRPAIFIGGFNLSMLQTTLCLLLLASLCAMTLEGCAPLVASSGFADSSHFVYSPYKYIPVALQPEPLILATVVDGAAVPLAVDGRSSLPKGVTALTLAFATGECATETWDGMDPGRLAESLHALDRAGIRYIISTGGAAGVFTCASDAGMETFIRRYASAGLIGFDFDIERGQSEAVVDSLVRRIKVAKDRHPRLRFSFTLATWAASDGSMASLNDDGQRVMRAIRGAELAGYYVNLMVMDYGDALPRNCVVTAGRCDMGRSSIQAARNFSATYGVPFGRIELTPMIGVNDVTANVFTLTDAAALARFVRDNGLAGVHFWSLDRDGRCAGDAAIVSSSCSGLAGLPPLAFTNAFRDGLAR